MIVFMEILKPLANLGKELTIEAGKGLYHEVIAPELALTPQQQETARIRSQFNQRDLIALMQIELEEELLQAHMQYPARMVSRLLGSDPQIHADVVALGDVRSQLAQNTSAPEVSSNFVPQYTPAMVSTM